MCVCVCVEEGRVVPGFLVYMCVRAGGDPCFFVFLRNVCVCGGGKGEVSVPRVPRLYVCEGWG